MKRIALIAAVLALNFFSFSYAFAEGTCGIDQNQPCNQFMNRLEIFKKLRAEEGNNEDAQKNLILLEKFQKQYGLDLKYAADNFLLLKETIGGTHWTKEARETFALIAYATNHSYPFHVLREHFAQILKAEKWDNMTDYHQRIVHEQVVKNFSFIRRAVGRGLSWAEATNLFVAIRKLIGGYYNSPEAQAIFNSIVDGKSQLTLNDHLEIYSRIFHSMEKDLKDSLLIYELVLQAAKKCGDLHRATNDFLLLLESLGGARYSRTAQEIYKKFYGTISVPNPTVQPFIPVPQKDESPEQNIRAE